MCKRCAKPPPKRCGSAQAALARAMQNWEERASQPQAVILEWVPAGQAGGPLYSLCGLLAGVQGAPLYDNIPMVLQHICAKVYINLLQTARQTALRFAMPDKARFCRPFRCDCTPSSYRCRRRSKRFPAARWTSIWRSSYTVMHSSR